jgi:hypothetical protein
VLRPAEWLSERQTLCKITESFLANATRALPLPHRLATACLSLLKTLSGLGMGLPMKIATDDF